MTFILDIFKNFFHCLKAFIIISDTIKGLVQVCSNLEDNIELMRGHLESMNGNLKNINTYGSEAAQKSFRELDRKIYSLDEKVDRTREDVAKVKGFLKMNGYPTTHEKQ